MIKIRTPIWKTRSVGINEKYLVDDEIKVQILYKDKEGNRMFPYTYKMESSKVKSYSTMNVKGNRLYIIPILDFAICWD